MKGQSEVQELIAAAGAIFILIVLFWAFYTIPSPIQSFFQNFINQIIIGIILIVIVVIAIIIIWKFFLEGKNQATGF